MSTKKSAEEKLMTDSQLSYLALHTCQWCKAVIKQGQRFLNTLQQSRGDEPWDENEQSSMFLADKVFLITAIYHAIVNLERFNYELEQRNDLSFHTILETIGTQEERRKIKKWRNMNEHDLDYLTGRGNEQNKFISKVNKGTYQFETNAFITFIHGDAKLFLVGDIEIDKLLMKFKDNLLPIQEKTKEVFYRTLC